MRVLFVTHFFPPEELSIAYLVKELADKLVCMGHQVDILTGIPNWPKGKAFSGYSNSGFMHEKMGGLNVYRIPFYFAPNGFFLQRVLDFKSFEFNARRYGRRLQHPDIIYVPVPPNEDALAARALAQYFSCPYIVNVQDIQPDGAIELGYIKNPLAIKMLRMQEKKVYDDAKHLVVIGDNFRGRLEYKGYPKGKISVLPNWIDPESVVPMNKINPLRREWSIPDDKFVVLYAGTFGRVHGTEIILRTAQILSNESKILFLMVGQGYDFEHCRKQVSEEDMKNVMIKSFVPRTRLSELQSIADVSIVSLRKGYGHSSVPSKVLGYMAAGRGVLALADKGCDTASLISAANCGRVLEPENPEVLAEEVICLHSDTTLVEAWGENARSYIEEKLSKNVVTTIGSELIQRICKG